MNVNLTLFKKNGSTRGFALPSSVTTIGRRQECDLCIPLMVISRKHCEINQDQGQLRIRDLGSRNGTFLNGHKIDEAVLDPGDKIQVGPLTFIIQIDNQPAELPTADAVHPQTDEDIFSPEQKSTDQAETIAHVDDFDMSDDYNPTDMLQELSEEAADNNQNT